ncbi:PIR protein [Plasmodium vivax]|uniref:VIR protein n=1 Tax=Plasmodium vivax TaxID=5855 RepID=A0A565A5G4_PLAVI|nr:PIR protein [Plasmodium vivax]
MYCKNISYNDLPSVKFENKIKELIDYSIFESYKKNITEEGVIDNWVQSFQEKVKTYSTDSSVDSSLNHVKRCKNFNYLLNVIINKLNSLSDNFVKRLEWSDIIRKSNEIFFPSNNNLSCKHVYAYGKSDYKDLDTFCEDSDFIMKKVVEIRNSVNCQNIAKNMSNRKDNLVRVRDKGMRGGMILKIDEECSIQFLDKIFPSITCNSSVKDSSQSDAFSPSVNHVDGDEASQELMTQQEPDHGNFTANREELVTTSGEIETKYSTSSNTLNTVGLPIFGVLGCSFLLYKFTPVGSIFRSRIQNKGIIPINNDGYSTNEVLPNIPNTNDIYSENAQYKIPYQTL